MYLEIVGAYGGQHLATGTKRQEPPNQPRAATRSEKGPRPGSAARCYHPWTQMDSHGLTLVSPHEVEHITNSIPARQITLPRTTQCLSGPYPVAHGINPRVPRGTSNIRLPVRSMCNVHPQTH